KATWGRVAPNGGLDVIHHDGPGTDSNTRRSRAHPVVDEPKVLQEIHPSRQGGRRADRERELPRVSLESIRRCVLDAERKGQWDRVRVEGSVRLEIDDGRQDLKSVCVEYFAAADGPFSRGPRGSELGRECPGGASAPAHGHYVGIVGPASHLGRSVRGHRQPDVAVQGESRREACVRAIGPGVPRREERSVHDGGSRGCRGRKEEDGRDDEESDRSHGQRFRRPRLRLLVHVPDSTTSFPLGLGRIRKVPPKRRTTPRIDRSRPGSRVDTSTASAPNARAVRATWVVTRLSRAGRWPSRRTVITAQSSNRMIRWPRKSRRGDRFTRAFNFVCVTFRASATSPENFPSAPTISKIRFSMTEYDSSDIIAACRTSEISWIGAVALMWKEE